MFICKCVIQTFGLKTLLTPIYIAATAAGAEYIFRGKTMILWEFLSALNIIYHMFVISFFKKIRVYLSQTDDV